MAPTEETLLSNFLLPPASLPSIITFRAFVDLFPPQQQSNPLIRILYRDLQHQRAIVTDAVIEDIEDEVKTGDSQRRAAVRARKAAEKEDPDDEIDIERTLFGHTSTISTAKPHTLKTILPEMQAALDVLQAEIQELQEEAMGLHDEISIAVDRLSDLRYGGFANKSLKEEVLEGLKRLETTCENK